jgi:hypothetical protein
MAELTLEELVTPLLWTLLSPIPQDLGARCA